MTWVAVTCGVLVIVVVHRARNRARFDPRRRRKAILKSLTLSPKSQPLGTDQDGMFH